MILYNFEGLLPSFKRWQKQGKADVDFLRGAFGNMVVPVRFEGEAPPTYEKGKGPTSFVTSKHEHLVSKV